MTTLMSAYRVYYLSVAGRIVSVVELHCEDDDSAIRAAQGHDRGLDMELWDGARVVRKFKRALDETELKFN